jgi:hypothetical protein
MLKSGDLLYGKFFSKGVIFYITSITQSELKGNILAHNMEGHVVNTVTVKDYIRRAFKKISYNDIPLYLDFKVFNPELTKLLKEHKCLRQEQ